MNVNISESVRWQRHTDSGGRTYLVRDYREINGRRVALGLSQRDLAHRVGCSLTMAGFLCTGRRGVVSEVLGRRLGEALACHPWFVLEGWGEVPSVGEVVREVCREVEGGAVAPGVDALQCRFPWLTGEQAAAVASGSRHEEAAPPSD